MKAKILKTFFNKEIKPNLVSQDWICKNHLIYKEIGNSELLRGFCFNSSAFSITQFEVIAFIQPLYVPCPFIFLTFGQLVKSPENMQWWDYIEDNKAELGEKLANYINQIDDNFLSKVTNADLFYRVFKNDKQISLAHFESVAYSACFADNLNSANEIAELKKYISQKEDMRKPYVNDIYMRTLEIEKTLGSREGLQELFNKWLSETKKALKL
ncbi:hypothetical protein [Emticicia sp. 17c]|uniref:hypothetical protein n=1 Tax=Emticicia sp. 17c TaxID=3127704 RepID=UPI00301DA642